jgi:salicylate hydroxylase
MDGTLLFNLPLADVAGNMGWRIRWADLYRVLRTAAQPTIAYGCSITRIGRSAENPAQTYLEWTAGGVKNRLDAIDLLIAADGRYSQVRRAISGVVRIRHVGVAMSRMLVRDTSAGLIDDYEQWFNGPNRLLAFRVPPAYVYIATAFPSIPQRAIPEHLKRPAALRDIYTPVEGLPGDQARWLIDTICTYPEDMHWARMQEHDLLYADPHCHVLYLGDAAHGMVPTLGQGATQAIEDAALAADVIAHQWAGAHRNPRQWLRSIDRRRRDRMRFVMRFSLEASDTMLAGSDPVAGTLHKTGAEFMAKLRRLYRGIPRLEVLAGSRNPSSARKNPMTTKLPSAAVHGLFHIAIKTSDLGATRIFWSHIIGLREIARPNFGYPGAWLACPQPGGVGIIHIYAGGPALGEGGVAPFGTSAIDHISLSCSGYRDYIARFEAAGLDWREFLVPGTTLWQLFVYDPSGVQLELTFEGSMEGADKPNMSSGRAYVAGTSFFDPRSYPKLGSRKGAA